MNTPGEILRRLHMLLHRRRFQTELAEEMQLHLDLRQQQHIVAGLPPDTARSLARHKFGNATHMKEKSYMTWGWEWLESFVQDAAYGARALLRSKALTIVALFSLALGIGANTAIFSLLDAVMLRSLPVKDPAQLVLLGKGNASGRDRRLRQNRSLLLPLLPPNAGKESGLLRHRRNLQHDQRRPWFRRRKNRIGTDKCPLVSGTYFTTLGVKHLWAAP